MPLARWGVSVCVRAGRRLAAILFSVAGLGSVDGNAASPNFVVVIADDLGYRDLRCFGDPVVHTPNLDRLAAEGLKLTDCYAAGANCSPARAGLMTGRTPARAGVTDWIPARSPMHLRREETTVATLLRRAGYATCLSGKWHLNSGPLFWYYYNAWSDSKVAIRDGDWKLLAHLDYPGPAFRNQIRPDVQHALRTADLTTLELYNLREDIGETNDLAAKEPERTAAMADRMRRIYFEVRAESPEWPAWTWNINDSPRAPLPSYYKPKSGSKKK